MGYLSGEPDHELIDGSHLREGSLVCMNCSWPTDTECYDAERIGDPCCICGEPCQPHEKDEDVCL